MHEGQDLGMRLMEDRGHALSRSGTRNPVAKVLTVGREGLA